MVLRIEWIGFFRRNWNFFMEKFHFFFAETIQTGFPKRGVSMEKVINYRLREFFA